MFFNSRKVFSIKKKVPSYIFLVRDNMWERCRKTSTFLNFFIIVNLLILPLASNLVSAKNSPVHKIAMIGDSLTQGYGLMPQLNLVSQLQERLSEDNYAVELLNFGVSGDTTAGGLERFEWSVSSDVAGVVILLGGNDLLRGISPVHSFQNLRKMIVKAKKRELPVLLVGMKASTNFGQKYKMEFDKIYGRLQTEFNLFYYPDFFNALNNEDVDLFLSFMQSDGIHPNANGVEKIVADFYPKFETFVAHILKID